MPKNDEFYKDHIFNFSQRKLAIVSIPNAGHIKILIRLIYAAKQLDPRLNVLFILTSWLGHQIRDDYINALKEVSGNDVIIFESKSAAHCKGDTFCRAIELIDKVIQACVGCDHIIYDFMTPEGYIAGKILSIPTICAEPSYVGELDVSSIEYDRQVKNCNNHLVAIEAEYKIKLRDKLKLVSGALSFHSSVNILFSWENFIHAGAFKKTLKENNQQYYFMRPSAIKHTSLDKEFSYISRLENKIVYFSLGTIASGIAWEEAENLDNNSLHRFIRFLYTIIINIFTKRQDLILIMSTGRNVVDMIEKHISSNNVYIYESLDQEKLLHHVDVFITHCGANSVNEAIDAETPMIGIPLMYDQHQCAQALQELDIGHAFLLPPEKREAAVYIESNIFFREPFEENDIEKTQSIVERTIDDILSRDFSMTFSKIKSGKTLSFECIHELLNNETIKYND